MNVDLRNGDCTEVMKTLDANSVDLVVTSPPYDNLREYNGVGDGWNFDKFKKVADELYRVVKDGGVVVWVVCDATIDGSETGTSFKQALYFKEIGFNIHDTMIWLKDTFSFPHKNRYRNVFEYMFVFSKGSPSHVYQIADRQNKWAGTKVHGTSRGADGETFRKSNDNKTNVAELGVRYNVWEIPPEKANKTGHPAVFPLQIATDHILSWSYEGDTVLDCFMGSGTTGIASINAKRNFIGIEMDETYFGISKSRIEEAQNTLFAM